MLNYVMIVPYSNEGSHLNAMCTGEMGWQCNNLVDGAKFSAQFEWSNRQHIWCDFRMEHISENNRIPALTAAEIQDWVILIRRLGHVVGQRWGIVRFPYPKLAICSTLCWMPCLNAEVNLRLLAWDSMHAERTKNVLYRCKRVYNKLSSHLITSSDCTSSWKIM